MHEICLKIFELSFFPFSQKDIANLKNEIEKRQKDGGSETAESTVEKSIESSASGTQAAVSSVIS